MGGRRSNTRREATETVRVQHGTETRVGSAAGPGEQEAPLGLCCSPVKLLAPAQTTPGQVLLPGHHQQNRWQRTWAQKAQPKLLMPLGAPHPINAVQLPRPFHCPDSPHPRLHQGPISLGLSTANPKSTLGCRATWEGNLWREHEVENRFLQLRILLSALPTVSQTPSQDLDQVRLGLVFRG